MKYLPDIIKPEKFPFFYGWLILVMGIIGTIVSTPGQTIGVSMFTEPLISHLEVSRVGLSLAYLIGTITSSLFLTYAGTLYDRFGARVVGPAASVFLALSLLYITRIGQINAFLVGIFPVSAPFVIFPLITLGFLGIRFFGQGVLTMVSRNMVMKWFNQRRGLVSALLGIFIAFGFSYAPRIFGLLIETYTWQRAYLMIAFFVGVVFTLLAIILFRDNPQQHGLIPDGRELHLDTKGSGPLYEPIRDYTLGEAVKHYSYWIYILSLGLFSYHITATTFHIVSIFETSGMNRDAAIAIFLPSAVVAVVTHFIAGWVSDYIRLKLLLYIHIASIMLSAAGVMFLGNEVPVWMLIAGNGISQGMFGILSTITWPRFYGTRHLGAISGFAASWMVAGSALGPFLFSLSLRWFDSYFQAGFMSLVIAAIMFVLSFRADNVNEKVRGRDKPSSSSE